MLLKINRNFIYCVFLFLYCFFSIIGSSYADTIIPLYSLTSTFLFYLTMIVMIFLMFSNVYVKRKWLIFTFLLMFLLFFILLKNNDKNLLILFFLLIGIPKDIDYDKLPKTIFYSNFLAILFVVFCCMLHVIPDYTSIRNGTIRHALGFVSANSLSNMITATILIYSYCKKNNWSLFNAILCLIILAVVYFYTNSRLGLLLGILVVLTITFFNFFNNNKFFSKFLFFISKFLFLFLLSSLILLTIYLSRNTNTSLYNYFNELFSGRLYQILHFYNVYGFHIIGKPIYTIGIRLALSSGVNWIGIDTSYINYTIRYGLLFMYLLSFCYYSLGSFFEKNGMLYESVIVIFVCLMGITENTLLLPYFNISLFWIYHFLLNQKLGRIGEVNV